MSYDENGKQRGVECQEPSCARTVDDGPLYRVNAKGQPGIFMCGEHATFEPEPAVRLPLLMADDAIRVHEASVRRARWTLTVLIWAVAAAAVIIDIVLVGS